LIWSDARRHPVRAGNSVALDHHFVMAEAAQRRLLSIQSLLDRVNASCRPAPWTGLFCFASVQEVFERRNLLSDGGRNRRTQERTSFPSSSTEHEPPLEFRSRTAVRTIQDRCATRRATAYRSRLHLVSSSVHINSSAQNLLHEPCEFRFIYQNRRLILSRNFFPACR